MVVTHVTMSRRSAQRPRCPEKRRATALPTMAPVSAPRDRVASRPPTVTARSTRYAGRGHGAAREPGLRRPSRATTTVTAIPRKAPAMLGWTYSQWKRPSWPWMWPPGTTTPRATERATTTT
jgi:hypothetical protein